MSATVDPILRAVRRDGSTSGVESATQSGTHRRAGRDDRRPTASAVELANQPVELLGVLHEHEVRTALVLLEDFGLRALDLFPDPDLGLPRNEARFATHSQSLDVDRWNEVLLIVGGVVLQHAGRILSCE